MSPGCSPPIRWASTLKGSGRINVNLRPKTACEEEWRLVDPDLPESFFRFWTAKEAVLKIGGAGIAHLLKCRVTHIQDDQCLLVRYQETEYRVRHVYFDGHVAAVVEGACPVRWALPDDPASEGAGSGQGE